MSFESLRKSAFRVRSVRRSPHNNLTWLAAISLVGIAVIYFSRHLPETFEGGAELIDKLDDILLGYIVSYIFYYVNFYMPERRKFEFNCHFVGECLARIAYNNLQFQRVTNNPDAEHVSILGFPGYCSKHFTPNIDMAMLNLKEYPQHCVDLEKQVLYCTNKSIPNMVMTLKQVMSLMIIARNSESMKSLRIPKGHNLDDVFKAQLNMLDCPENHEAVKRIREKAMSRYRELKIQTSEQMFNRWPQYDYEC